MSGLGEGKERGIAFGGGGEWFVAWTVSFLTGGRLWRGGSEMEFLASHPQLLAKMVKTGTGSESQRRAASVLEEAKSTDREEVVAIGRAAMASRNTRSRPTSARCG